MKKEGDIYKLEGEERKYGGRVEGLRPSLSRERGVGTSTPLGPASLARERKRERRATMKGTGDWLVTTAMRTGMTEQR